MTEFQEAQAETKVRQEEELGDLLFSCVNLARHAGVDAEAALRRATHKFESRFNKLEAAASRDGKALEEMDLNTLDGLWEAAKRDA